MACLARAKCHACAHPQTLTTFYKPNSAAGARVILLQHLGRFIRLHHVLQGTTVSAPVSGQLHGCLPSCEVGSCGSLRRSEINGLAVSLERRASTKAKRLSAEEQFSSYLVVRAQPVNRTSGHYLESGFLLDGQKLSDGEGKPPLPHI